MSRIRVCLSALGLAIVAISCQRNSSPLATSSEASAVVSVIKRTFIVSSPAKQGSKSMPLLSTVRSSDVAALIPHGERLEPQFVMGEHLRSNRASIELPKLADGKTIIADRDSNISVGLRVAEAQHSLAEYADGYAVYRSATKSGADIIHRLTRNGLEDFFYFRKEPATSSIEYDIELSSEIVGLRFFEGNIEFLSADGAPHLHMARPYVQDSTGHIERAYVELTGCAYDSSPNPPWRRNVVAPRASHCRLRARWNSKGLQYPALVDPSWTSGHDLTTARYFHAAAALDGKVLVIGGADSSAALTSCELYDPATDTVATVASLNVPRALHTATYIPTIHGVLVSGGVNGNAISSSEVYKLTNGNWGWTLSSNQMQVGRGFHGAVYLPTTNKVFLIGGELDGSTLLSSTELYDPVTDRWSSTPPPPMSISRLGSTPVLIDNNTRVFMAGGFSGNSTLSSAEFYSLSTNSWTTAPAMTSAHQNHSTIGLADGRVIIVGGDVNTAQIYKFDGNPPYGSWSAETQFSSTSRVGMVGGYLGSSVVVAGGAWNWNRYLETDIFDPAAGTWHIGSDLGSFAFNSPTIVVPRNSDQLQAMVTMGGDALGGPATMVQSFALSAAGAACQNGSDCGTGLCITGFCCNSTSCQCAGECSAGTGICSSPLPAGSTGSPSCAPYSCDGSSTGCPAPCTADSDCSTSSYCNTTRSPALCRAKLANGAVCRSSHQCASGDCVEGYCCSSSSCGACGQCSTGVCGPRIQGSAGGPPTCSPFVCDGSQAACPTTCTSNQDCVSGSTCNGSACTCPSGTRYCGSAGGCLVSTLCCTASDCTTPPDSCHIAAGSACAQGVCFYPEVQCQPNQECLDAACKTGQVSLSVIPSAPTYSFSPDLFTMRVASFTATLTNNTPNTLWVSPTGVGNISIASMTVDGATVTPSISFTRPYTSSLVKGGSMITKLLAGQSVSFQVAAETNVIGADQPPYTLSYSPSGRGVYSVIFEYHYAPHLGGQDRSFYHGRISSPPVMFTVQ